MQTEGKMQTEDEIKKKIIIIIIIIIIKHESKR